MSRLNITHSIYNHKIIDALSFEFKNNGFENEWLALYERAGSLIHAETVYQLLEKATEQLGDRALPYRIGKRLFDNDVENGIIKGAWIQTAVELSAHVTTVSNYATLHFDILGDRIIWGLKRNSLMRESVSFSNGLMLGYMLNIVKRSASYRYSAEQVLVHSKSLTYLPKKYRLATQLVTSEYDISVNFPSDWIYGEKEVPTVASVSEKESAIGSVRKLCRQYLKEGGCGIEQVAESCHMTVRTLQRLLRNHQLTYRQLLLEEKLALAEDMLFAQHKIEMVAKYLGFSNLSSFGRFFKSMTGQTPKQFVDSVRDHHI